jgi:hypothetical protein
VAPLPLFGGFFLTFFFKLVAQLSTEKLNDG